LLRTPYYNYVQVTPARCSPRLQKKKEKKKEKEEEKKPRPVCLESAEIAVAYSIVMWATFIFVG